MNDTALDSQIRAFVDLMTRPEGILGAGMVLALIVAVIANRSFKWVVLTLLLWVATFSIVLNIGDQRPAALLPGFELIRSNGRPLCVALLLVLTIPSLLTPGGWRGRWFNSAGLALFLFQIAFAVRMAMGGDTSRGIASLLIYPLIFVPLGIGLNRWLQDWKDAHAMLRCIVGMGMLFFVGTVIHLILSYSVAVRGMRLYGTSGNPQMVGALLAGVIPVICYFLIRPGQRLAWRVALAALVGFLIIMLAWTGSRTGIAVTLVGVALFFRGRIGRLALSGMTVAIFVLLALQIYSESTATFTDMFIRGDTRSHVWTELLKEFLDHIAWGSMNGEFSARENSYLTVAANAGLFGVVPMLLFLFVTGWQLVRLHRVRRLLGDYILLADLATSGLLSLAAVCMFEGFICGTMTFQVFACFMYLALTTFLIDAAKAMAARGFEVAQPAVLTDEEYSYSYEPGPPQPQPLEV